MRVVRKDRSLAKDYRDERISFFATEKGGRILKLRVHLRPTQEGNILWYLFTKDLDGNEERFLLKLEEMNRLGLLLLLLSKFCINTEYLSERSVRRILDFERFWKALPE